MPNKEKVAILPIRPSYIDIKVLQMIMGHSDISITMNIYNHVDAARVQNEMKKLENVM